MFSRLFTLELCFSTDPGGNFSRDFKKQYMQRGTSLRQSNLSFRMHLWFSLFYFVLPFVLKKAGLIELIDGDGFVDLDMFLRKCPDWFSPLFCEKMPVMNALRDLRNGTLHVSLTANVVRSMQGRPSAGQAAPACCSPRTPWQASAEFSREAPAGSPIGEPAAIVPPRSGSNGSGSPLESVIAGGSVSARCAPVGGKSKARKPSQQSEAQPDHDASAHCVSCPGWDFRNFWVASLFSFVFFILLFIIISLSLSLSVSHSLSLSLPVSSSRHLFSLFMSVSISIKYFLGCPSSASIYFLTPPPTSPTTNLHCPGWIYSNFFRRSFTHSFTLLFLSCDCSLILRMYGRLTRNV